MKPDYHPSPWAATLLTALFAGGTAYVLFEDILRHGAPVTTAHVQTLLALVGTIAAGHYIWPEIKAGRLVSAIGCALLFLAGTAYIVTASGARNAEAQDAKAASVRAANGERAGIEKLIAEAEFMLAPCAAGTPKEHLGERCGLRAAMAKECASGNGGRCRGKTYSVETFEAAIVGHRAKLKALGATADEHGGYAHAARVLAALPGVTASAEDLTERLVLVLPFLLVAISEIGTLVFGSMAVGALNRPASPPDGGNRQSAIGNGGPQIETAKPAPSAPVQPQNVVPFPAASFRPAPVGTGQPKAHERDAKASVLSAIQAELAAGRTFPSQRELCEAYGVARSTMSDWLGEWERAGLIPSRLTVGRCKRLATG